MAVLSRLILFLACFQDVEYLAVILTNDNILLIIQNE